MRNLIRNIDEFTINDLDALVDCFEDRYNFEQNREPESDGMVHDEWDDRVADLEEIMEALETCDDENDFKEVIELIKDFQIIHGGLSRIKIS